MFSSLLHKSIQVGDKIFHILCDMNINADELKNFGIEVLKVASEAEEAIKKQKAEQAAKEAEEKEPSNVEPSV